ncbi:sulfatase-like hydrolase/transferase, partial [candidate division GN15 bacterium]|nr:sulfatase-like hydrolase/transferase [candidate division GN15 bacterium]
MQSFLRSAHRALFLAAFTLSPIVASAEAQGPEAEPIQAVAAEAVPTTPPNILVVLFDDVGFTGFGAYGGDARTPNIDALAQSGTLFSRYYSSPFCGPSRAMLMTGMDNHQTGMGTLVETVTPEQRALPGYSMLWEDDQETIATRLSDAGYRTYVSGKWGIGAKGKNLPDRFGFDRSYVMDSTGGSNYDHTHYLPGYP